MPTQVKAEQVERLRARLSGVKVAVLTEYRGLTVQQLSDLRRQLRQVAGEYTVIKNRLARRALQGSPLDGLGPHLTGPTGLAISEQDAVRLAKALHVFAKSNALFQIKVGYAAGQLLEAAELRMMADLPSREVLLGQLMGTLQAPVAQLAATLEGMLRSLVSALDQVRVKKEGGAT